MNKFICIDFDGTIVDHQFPLIGLPVPGAIEWMKKWQEMGANLILYTMRSDRNKFETYLKDAVHYLEINGIKLYGANVNHSQYAWTESPKVYAHIYIDDAGFGCPLIRPNNFVRPCVDWSIVGPAVASML